MVSPVDKNGAEVTLGAGSFRAAAEGGAVLFDSNVAFADGDGTGVIGGVVYRADRTGSGWRTRSLMPRQPVQPGADLVGAEYAWFDPDLNAGILRAIGPLRPGAPEGAYVSNLYLVDGDGAGPTLLTPSANPPITGIPFFYPRFADASEDRARFTFGSPQPLTAEASPGVFNLFEWDHGTVRLAGVLPDSQCGSPPCLPSAGATPGFGGSLLFGDDTDRTISDDGSRVFFTSPPDETGQLYMRRDATTTYLVSQSEASSPDPTARPSRFWTASADGLRVFFTTSEQLLDGDQNPSEESEASRDLYMYVDSDDPEADANLVLISADQDPSDGADTGVQGVLGSSTDGAYVYFVAANRLVAGQDPVEEAATAETPALYAWHEGSLRYVATLASSGLPESLNWNQKAISRTSRVTPDGRHLVFTSVGLQPGGFENSGHAEIYRYSAENEILTCVSCGPLGNGPAADASIHFPATSGTLQHPTYAHHPISIDGGRVFFNTVDALVGTDTNGKFDAYEWEAEGLGGCADPQGCLALLSSGSGSSDSYFVDADAQGESAYIVTRERLSARDVDDGRDLYVARVEGGFPEPPTPPADCRGSDCQGVVVLPPPPTAPATSAVLGAGNRKAKQHKKHRRRGKHHKKRGKGHQVHAEHRSVR